MVLAPFPSPSLTHGCRSAGSRTSSRRRCCPPALAGHAFAALALLAVVAAPAAAQQVSFQFYMDYFDESEGIVAVSVSISGPAQGSVGVAYQTVAGTALPGQDYQSREGFLSWANGQSSTKTILIPLVDDAVAEDYELFRVALTVGDGVTIGEPDTTEVWVLDDDTVVVPTATFVVPPGLPTNNLGDPVYCGPPGGAVEAQVRISNVESWPVSVPYTIEGDAQTHQLLFEAGEIEKTLTVPATDVPPGSLALARRVALQDPAKRFCATCFLTALLTAFDTEFNSLECLWLALYDLGCEAGFIEFCDDGPQPKMPDAGPGLARRFGGTLTPAQATTALQRYRDEILAPSLIGPFYIDLYRQFSGEVVIAALQHPTFLFELLETAQEWVAGIDALVNGSGDSFTISSQMVQDLTSVVFALSSAADVETSTALANEYSRLQLDNAAGMTMSQLQTQLEQLGGRVANEQESWGALKSRFGEPSKR